MKGLTKAQQRLRDKLLRESGFVDIEDEAGEMKLAANWLQYGRRGRSSTAQEMQRDIDTTAAYYQRAGQLLHEHPFRSPVERRIWELHAEGASYTRIWRTVRREMDAGDLSREKMYRRRVHAVVNRVRAVMMGKAGKKRGRPMKPDSMRQGGMALFVRLDPTSALALDHIRTVLQAGAQETIRLALKKLARNSGYP